MTTYFAQVENGIVTNLIVADQDFINTLPDPSQYHEYFYPPCEAGKVAGIGYVYNSTDDVFYQPQPYPSWTLNHTTWQWDAPTPRPNNNLLYYWDEATLSWILYPEQLNQTPVIIGEKNLQGGGSIKFYPPSDPPPNITQWMWKEKGASTYTIFTNVDNSVTITIPTSEDIVIGCINNGVEMWSSNDVLVTPL